MDKPPTFFRSWIDDLTETKKRYPWHLVPWRLTLCAAFGALVATSTQSALFFPSQRSTTIALYAGILAFNALTMTLAWSGISRVYETLMTSSFSSFLKRNGILQHYQFTLEYIHAAQTLAALTTILALCALISGNLPLVGHLPVVVHRIGLGATITFTLYALWWAYSAATVAKELSWYYATFDQLTPDQKMRLTVAVDNTRSGS